MELFFHEIVNRRVSPKDRDRSLSKRALVEPDVLNEEKQLTHHQDPLVLVAPLPQLIAL